MEKIARLIYQASWNLANTTARPKTFNCRRPIKGRAYDFGRLIGGTMPFTRYAVTSLP